MSGITPTEEQQAIIEAACSGKTIAINALAGTGKTSTLRMIAEALPRKQIAYLAFNKSIVSDVQEAGMPGNVAISTFHSLAYRAVRPSRERLSQTPYGRHVANEFGLQDVEGGGYMVEAADIGAVALDAVGRFCNSADRELLPCHVRRVEHVLSAEDDPQHRADLDEVNRAVAAIALDAARRIWAAQCDANSSFPMLHDAYVKLWALGNPTIAADVVLFDEAQDASPVFIDIVERQQAQAVWVGDQNQQIYEWRGAVNALDRVQADQRLFLSQSFRFGENVADVANVMLTALGAEKPIIGAGGAARNIGQAVLCRTNATAVAELMRHVKAGHDVELVGGQDMLRVMKDLQALQEGRPRGQFALFRSFQDLARHAETESGQQLRVLVKLVQEYDIERIIDTLDETGRKSKKGRRADYTVSTCHKSKGREWDRVAIAGDWPDPEKLEAPDLRLLYVTVTRARVDLDVSAIQKHIEVIKGRCGAGLDETKTFSPLAETPPEIGGSARSAGGADELDVAEEAVDVVQQQESVVEEQQDQQAPVPEQQRRLVTPESVAAACEALLARGEKVTTRSVRAELGGGNFSVIVPLVGEWKRQNAGRNLVAGTAGDGGVEKIFEMMRDHIARLQAQARENVASDLAEAVSERDSLLDELDQVRAEEEKHQKILEQQAGEIAALRARLEDASRQIGVLMTERDREREEASRLRVELAKAELRLEGVESLKGELICEREARRRAEVEAGRLSGVIEQLQSRDAGQSEGQQTQPPQEPQPKQQQRKKGMPRGYA